MFYFFLEFFFIFSIILNSEPNGDENQPSITIDGRQGVINDRTVQQMTHGFVALFEKELDQVQHSLKEALYVSSLQHLFHRCSFQMKKNKIIHYPISRSKQEKMGVELERLNVEHAMESRQDCQELVSFSKDKKNNQISLLIGFFIRFIKLCVLQIQFNFQFYMVKDLTDKLHLIKKRMLNMHQRVKHLEV